MATSGKGLPFIGKMNEFLDRILHPTVNKVGHSKAALDVTSRAFYAVNDIFTPSVAEAGSTDNILVCTGLNAVAGDVIRFVSTAEGILEREITVHEVLGPNEVILAGYLSGQITAGDEFHLLRPTVPLVSSDGASLATVISPPIQIIKDGIPQTVEDSTTPADVVAIPVKIMAVDGTNINITAGDIDINTTSEGSNFDSMRIGNGSGNYAAVNGDEELQTHDQGVIDAIGALVGGGLATEAKQDDIIAGLIDVETELQTLNTVDFATEAKQDTQITRLNLLATEAKQDTQITRLNLLATEAKQDTQITRLNLLATEVTLNDIKTKALTLATETKQDSTITAIGLTNTALGTPADSAATTDTGTFSIISFIKRSMQNWTSLLAKIPALGQTNKAGSVSVVLASNSDALTAYSFGASGSAQKGTIVASGSTTAVAPANAIGCFIKNSSLSDGTLFYEIGATATSGSADLVSAQGTAFIPCTGTISLVAHSDGAVNYCVQWVIK